MSREDLRDANAGLVIATLQAQTLAAASEDALGELREANENLVAAAVHAQTVAALSEQAAEQMAFRARQEARLQDAQKLESLGVLAGGVAHDFNNLLTSIMGNANLASLAVKSGKEAEPYFEAIEKAAMKAADLTRQLLAYAGKGRMQVEAVDLGVVLREAALILSASLPRNVVLDTDLADRIPFVKADSTQIFRVMMNLITNAAEACPGDHQGRITLRTRAERVDAVPSGQGTWVLPVTPGDYAVLEVADTGTGMTPEVMGRAFEPFFTTKFPGRGLGLAATLGVLRSHGGGLRVRSESGQGSSMTVFLPAMREDRIVPNLEPLPDWRGSGLVLVVDEDGEVRSTLRGIAERQGFSVLEAGNGPEALSILRKRHGNLDLVLMDPASPHPPERNLLQDLRALDDRVAVVLGRAFSLPEARTLPEGATGLLTKPYRTAEVLGLLKRVAALRSPGAA